MIKIVKWCLFYDCFFILYVLIEDVRVYLQSGLNLQE